MSRGLIQDIKRSKKPLADVLPRERERSAPKLVRPEPAQAFEPSVRQRRGGWFKPFSLVVILALVVFYFGSRFLVKAIIVVSPRNQIFSLDTSLVALTEGLNADSSEGPTVHFRTMTVKAEAETMLKALGRTEVSERASGEIIINNRQSEDPQKLIINTRFATADGKIYRLREPVTIPGYRRTGGEIVPGELKVTVYADESGADYNGEVGELTIPGFKDDPRFETIRARGVTPMTGGFIGERSAISPGDKSMAEDRLIENLKQELRHEADLSLPVEFVNYQTLDSFDFQSEILENGDTPKLIVRGELLTAIFSQEELSNELAREIGGFELTPGEALINNLRDLSMSVSNTSLNIAQLSEVEKLDLRLVGEAKLVWQFDEMTLKQDLAGTKKSDYDQVFVAYPSLVKTEVAIKPPWIGRFPSRLDRIEIRLDR